MVATTDLEAELEKLIKRGELLYYAMALDLGLVDEDQEKQLKKLKLPTFKTEYDRWYSVALRVIAQVLPDRLDDFVLQYKDPKRKDITFLTYTISDYMLGLETTRGFDVVTDGKAAIRKMERQNAILGSAQDVFKSTIVDVAEVLQADLFDSELDAATELARKGFIRGGGAVAGVVLEKHLGHVARQHGFKSRKKNPTINDFNQFLKDGGVLDTAKWRFIQHLGDLRNLCDHPKERDPSKEDVTELVEGVHKVLKTVA